METDVDLRRRAESRIWCAVWCAISLLLLSCAGCSVIGSRGRWYEAARFDPTLTFATADESVASAESQYEAGLQAEAAGDATCIDRYYAAATATWPQCLVTPAPNDDPATDLYRSSVQSFIQSAIRFGRFQRTQGVLLTNGLVVPVRYVGFVWQPDDFCTFLPVGSYESSRLANRYVGSGVGLPYVVLTTNPPRYAFTNGAQPFAATAILSPSASCGGGFALQFYDPLHTSTSAIGLPLARDLTAPIAYAASQESDAWLEDFLRPAGNDVLNGLHMREPYQPGKIPVVFVHGLASDPLTWVQLENDLRAQPEIYSRYQFWFFRYDTGDPFLSSAARLRRHLAELRQTYDPLRRDPSMSRIVLVGHSMGGLISKMQVTYSGDEIWRSAATRPFETIVTDPVTRSNLTEAFFFTPSPDIKQVIYIATPHNGSGEAERFIGQISSALIEERPEAKARHEQITRDNPGLFREELRQRVPNSIDLLEPDSLILQATERLPYGYGIATHSIIGDDPSLFGEEPSDGVVPLSSARVNGVQTELVVDARHTQVQRDPNTVREVICILSHHAAGGL
jgi:Alpha/beta hydrolase family